MQRTIEKIEAPKILEKHGAYCPSCDKTFLSVKHNEPIRKASKKKLLRVLKYGVRNQSAVNAARLELLYRYPQCKYCNGTGKFITKNYYSVPCKVCDSTGFVAR